MKKLHAKEALEFFNQVMVDQPLLILLTAPSSQSPRSPDELPAPYIALSEIRATMVSSYGL
jgi:hypothetical protein